MKGTRDMASMLRRGKDSLAGSSRILLRRRTVGLSLGGGSGQPNSQPCLGLRCRPFSGTALVPPLSHEQPPPSFPRGAPATTNTNLIVYAAGRRNGTPPLLLTYNARFGLRASFPESRSYIQRGLATKVNTDPQEKTSSSSSSSVVLPPSSPRPHVGKPPMPRKLGRVKIPTPEKALPPEAKPGGLLNRFDPQKLAKQSLGLLRSVVVTLATYAYKLPYWTWYYSYHAKERRAMITQLKDMAKHEAEHYWNGTKLLVEDVRTARTLMGKTLDGNALTRRERKQLLRTVSDLFRIVPFSMFIIIPFMEFVLPFALRIFPNLLPSTFQDSLKAEESMKRELQSRIAMAQFFQETLETLAQEQKKKAVRRRQELEETGNDPADIDSTIHKQEDSAASMLEFLSKARNGEMIPPNVIIRYANYFQDDLTLDNMPRMQLINMCRYMNIPPYGADSFLRFQLRHRIRSLKEDDQRILWEGIDSLTKMELREAVQERGMRSTGLSKDSYKRALQQWLDLSVNKNVPIALLIMSRTFFLQDEIPPIPSQTSSTKAPPVVDDSKSKKLEFDSIGKEKSSKGSTVVDAMANVTPTAEADAIAAKNDVALTGLADAISGLDKQVLNEVILNLATSEEKTSDPEIRKLKLEVLRKQNELIQREEQDREEAKKQKAMTMSESFDGTSAASTPVSMPAAVSSTSVASDTAGETTAAETSLPLDGSLTTEEMDALRTIITDDPVSTEREALEEIKAAMKEDIKPDQPAESQYTRETVEGHAKQDFDIGSDSHSIIFDKAEDELGSTTQKQSDAVSFSDHGYQTTAVESMSGSSSDSFDFGGGDETEGDVVADETEDPVVSRLKRRLESMVDKIEVQLSETEVKIGDKMHFLDKDRDGILSREEVAEVLQQVFKKNISLDEAIEIANEMDDNHDGVFTVDELLRWIDENRLVRFVEEGRDIDIEKLIESKTPEGHESSSAETTSVKPPS